MVNVSQEAINMDSKMYNSHFQECKAAEYIPSITSSLFNM